MPGTLIDADAWAKRAQLTFGVAITVLAATVIGGGDAQANGGAKYDFRVHPRVGTPTTTFRVKVTAPLRTNGDLIDYTLQAVGPRRCPALFDFTLRPIRRGARVVMELTPSNTLEFRAGNRRTWCPGSYVGYVYHSGLNHNTIIGYFSFGVGRFPVSLAP
jgi:hypothetical protein